MKVKVVVGSNGKLPTRGTSSAAGWDIYAAEDGLIEPGTQKIVKTDIFMEIEEGWFADVRPRSGTAAKNEIGVTNSPGTIDSDYRGEVCVMLRNFSLDKPFKFAKGDRIGQLVFHQVHPVVLLQADTLGETRRGAGGFGSTGK